MAQTREQHSRQCSFPARGYLLVKERERDVFANGGGIPTCGGGRHLTFHRIQTMRNMLYMMFTGQVASGFELYAQAQVTFDHALVRRTWPMGVWVQAQVGASYRF